MDIEVVRRRLLLSIAGALAAGCGPVVVLPDGGDGEGSTSETPADSGGATTAVGTTTGHGSTHSDSATTGPEPEPQTTSDDATGGDELLDFGGKPIPAECVPQPPPPAEECGAPLPTQYDDMYFVFHCVGLSEGVSCESWAEGFNEPQHGWTIIECSEDLECSGPYAVEIGCGPLPDFGDQCCFWFAVVDMQICPGRPFVVAGRERLAPVSERDDWKDDTVLAIDARPLERAAIAAAWAEQAAFEHASVASFSRFILQLLACGAPARLLTGAQRALGEEIEHAQLFFGFASHYAGRPLGPSALDVRDALEESADFDAIVLAAVREGCIAETISAWHVSLAATSARDPAMARTLARVAEQELEHAALAWAFLAWALPRASDTLRARIEETFHEAERHVPRGPTLDSNVRSAAWLAHGILPAQEHATATRHALRELVDPVARSLMNVVAPAPRAAAASERPSAS